MEATEFLNSVDPTPYESLSSLDRIHRLVASGIWEIPVGHGRRYGATMPRALNFIAGGWQLNGVCKSRAARLWLRRRVDAVHW